VIPTDSLKPAGEEIQIMNENWSSKWLFVCSSYNFHTDATPGALQWIVTNTELKLQIFSVL
jgi:hypothetical protein